MLSMRDKAQEFAENGYVRVPGILSTGEISTYRTALHTAIQRQDERWKDNPYYVDHAMVHNPMTHDPVFLDLLANSVLNDHLEELFDPHCILYAFTTSSMPPSGSNFSHRIHVDCPRHIDGYPTNVGFLIAIDAFTEENGATYFLPGSHKFAKQPSEEEFMSDAKRIRLAPGEGVMFNARTWHMGGRNDTNEYRHALSINVCRPFMRQRFDYPRLLGDEMLDRLDERLLRFLGYRVRTPVTLEEYYVPTEERLYWSGQG